MKLSTKEFAEKIHAVCQSEALWKGFLVVYAILFAADLLLTLIAENKPKWWNFALMGAGAGVASYHLKRVRREKQEADA